MGKRSHGLTLAHAQQHAAKHGYQLADRRTGATLTPGSQSGRTGGALVASKPLGKVPNKTEAEYGMILRVQFPNSNVRYEAYTLKLAEGCRYVPDWAVEHPDGTLEFFEVKGAFIFSKALTKPKTAAELFPQRFSLAQKLKTGWEVTPLFGKFDRQK